MNSSLYIKAVNLTKPVDKDSYLKNVPSIKFLIKNKSLSLSHNVTFIVGENGMGKSTLIEGIATAYGFSLEGGSKNITLSTKEAPCEAEKYISLSKGKLAKDGFFLRAESFYNVAFKIEELYEDEFLARAKTPYGIIPLHNQSHGEGFLALVQNRFKGEGLYILDEPESALSPMRLMTLMIEISNLVNKNSQFIIATHSPILMTFPNASILEITNEGIYPVSYEETQHFRLTKDFLQNPSIYLKHLLKD